MHEVRGSLHGGGEDTTRLRISLRVCSDSPLDPRSAAEAAPQAVTAVIQIKERATSSESSEFFSQTSISIDGFQYFFSELDSYIQFLLRDLIEHLRFDVGCIVTEQANVIKPVEQVDRQHDLAF